MKPELYLAGPDVFRPNAAEIGEQLIRICETYHCKGIFPLFGGESASDAHKTAEGVSNRNHFYVRGCHALIGNITPFRGPNVDDGTAYEIGGARLLGKPTFLYAAHRKPYADRVRYWTGFLSSHDGAEGRDHHGDAIENFGLQANLMITPPGNPVFGCAEEAIRAAAIHFGVWSAK